MDEGYTAFYWNLKGLIQGDWSFGLSPVVPKRNLYEWCTTSKIIDLEYDQGRSSVNSAPF